MDKNLSKINENDLDAVTGGILVSAGVSLAGGTFSVGETKFYHIKDVNEAENFLMSCGLSPRDQEFKDYMEAWKERNAREGGGVSGSW